MRNEGGEGGGHAREAPCMQVGNEGDGLEKKNWCWWWVEVGDDDEAGGGLLERRCHGG